ncbi:hypothetical protein SAMN05445850_1781 [Paraburkholderia tuberum]|uniref:Uncharacterized protein n=1 Tax=Paraburkholderia tuberum TaxID=157910 RepID=A0A1H1DUI5_9BURK|nr:hypothetical protein [Paraburkholderia tuberum]SDQ80077.1 hypothetical protein SAMN05445850_1781 [Paraburkholderia tuberum]
MLRHAKRLLQELHEFAVMERRVIDFKNSLSFFDQSRDQIESACADCIVLHGLSPAADRTGPTMPSGHLQAVGAKDVIVKINQQALA